MTAPGLRSNAQPASSGQKRNTDNDGEQPKKKSKSNQKQRLRNQLAQAKANAAQQTPGQKGGGKGSKGDGKGAKGAKGGKAEFGPPAGAKWVTTVGEKPICFKWNANKACVRSPCNFEHVCWICEKSNHRGCEHNNRS